jgi:hypothetical protein
LARRTSPAFIVRDAAILFSSRRSCGANFNLIIDTHLTHQQTLWKSMKRCTRMLFWLKLFIERVPVKITLVGLCSLRNPELNDRLGQVFVELAKDWN